MGHGKETPRQKMIGMMYLVLTALLALNVSKSVLDSFVLVDNSLTVTTENFNVQNGKLYADFDQAYASNKPKVQKWKDKADIIRKEAEELYNYINSLKVKIVTKADGGTEAISKNKIVPGLVKSKDDTNKPAEIMVGDHNNGEAKILREKISKFRELLLSYVDKKDLGTRKAIENNLETKDTVTLDGEKELWENEHFEHLPLIAVTTIMSKMQSDVRNSESDILRYLFNRIDAGSFKFNKLEPTVIPNTNYVLKGNEYNAEVFIAAADTTQKPVIMIGQKHQIKTADGRVDWEMVGKYETLPVNDQGRGIMKRSAGSVGKVSWGGIIQLKTPDGSYINTPFDEEYMIAESNVVVSPTKMNVLYVGVPNPISISVPGVPSEKISASLSGGVLSKSGNNYLANLLSVGNSKAYITVVAEIDGKKKEMGKMEFRVKTIPDPIAKINNRKSGGIDRNTLLAQMIVIADLENFDFDAPFKVVEFTVSGNIGGFSRDITSNSNKILDSQREIIKGIAKGQKVSFENIKAVGPDGKPRELNPIIFKIQ